MRRNFRKRRSPKYTLSFESVCHPSGEIDLRSVLTATDLVGSRSEASRQIKQGAVDIHGKKTTKYTIPIGEFAIGEATTIHVGKLRWAEIKLAPPTIPGVSD